MFERANQTMIVSSKMYFKHLLSENEIRSDLKDNVTDFMSSGNKDYSSIISLYSNSKICKNYTIEFYKFLIKKLHKIVTELLSEEPKTACECIKTITSIITQATITIEKQFDNLEDVNEFIECVGLRELSNSLFVYFSTSDLSEIEKQLMRVRNDILFVKNNFC